MPQPASSRSFFRESILALVYDAATLNLINWQCLIADLSYFPCSRSVEEQ